MNKFEFNARDYEAAVVEFKSWAIIYCTLAIIPGKKIISINNEYVESKWLKSSNT